ncbi:MAG: maleylpyruvate isomerase N-terminal domain-containing protein [Dehalococcoidia bacterium]
MSKAEALAQVDAARQELLSALDGVSEDEAGRPIAGGWTLKELLGHVVGWDNNYADRLTEIAAGRESIPDEENVDAENQSFSEMYGDAPLSEVVERVRDGAVRRRQALDALSEDHFRPEALGWLIAEGGAGHHREHAADIMTWRRGAPPQA